MTLFQLHFLQNAFFQLRMAPRWGHLCCVDTFLFKNITDSIRSLFSSFGNSIKCLSRGVRRIQSNPHHFDSKVQFGYSIYSKIVALLPFYLILLKFQQDHFTIEECVKNCLLSCKQDRPWSDAAFCGIWSGSVFCAQTFLFKYSGLLDQSELPQKFWTHIK